MLNLRRRGEGGRSVFSYCRFFHGTFGFFHEFVLISVAGRGGLTTLGKTCSSTLRRTSPRGAARKEADR